MKKRNLGVQVYLGTAFGVMILVSMLVFSGMLSEVAKLKFSRLATSNVVDEYELIRKYRQRSSTGKEAAMSAIALTAFAMKKDQMAALHAAFDAHVAQPIQVQKLVDAIGAVRDGRAGVDA